MPWNLAFDEGLVCTPGEATSLEVRRKRGEPRITLHSPTPSRLDALFKVWDRELDRLRKQQRSEAAAPVRAAARGLGEPTVEDIAARDTRLDKAEPNGSSIAVMQEHRGVSVIQGADAVATVLAPALQQLARSRHVNGPLWGDHAWCRHRASVDRWLGWGGVLAA